MKETFIIRSEWYGSISKLTESEQAIIFKNLFEYHLGNYKNIDLSTISLQLVWGLIEPSLKRNIENYDRRCETSAQNGKLGGRPPKNGKPKKPNSKPNNPIETLNDSDSDSDSVNENDKIIPFEVFWNTYNYKKDRADTVKAWNKLSQKDQRAAYHHIKTYESSLKEWQSKRYPATYLNKRTWEDVEPTSTIPTLSILKAVRLDENENVVYENGKIYAPQSLEKLANYKSGNSDISIFDRKVS